MTAFAVHAISGAARRGTLDAHARAVETPAFMPVGTAATVKGITPADLRRDRRADHALQHLSSVAAAGARNAGRSSAGLHRFMAWDRPILTDSGGFQVFSLESRRDLDDDGVTFRSHLDGSTHRFTPENVVGFRKRSASTSR